MKTIDEVIKAYELCHASVLSCEGCPYDNGERWRDSDCYLSDALHYLKAYKDDRDDLTALRAYWAEQQANPALTWEQLKGMEGKPVWVEYDDHFEGRKRTQFKEWEVIDCILDDRLVVKGEWDYHKSELGDIWQAYRKERE